MTSVYEYGPDSQRQPGVPQGTMTAFQHVSTIFPDARREYWVYVGGSGAHDGLHGGAILPDSLRWLWREA